MYPGLWNGFVLGTATAAKSVKKKEFNGGFCKAISIAAQYDGDVWEDFWARPGIFDFEPLPLGVIVTVTGTGSECNGGAVITNEELKIKTGRDYPKCNHRFALLDPVYT